MEPTLSRRPASLPWLTYAILVLCSVIWLYLNLGKSLVSYENVVDFLVPSQIRIWHGAYWGLLTTPFVHFAIWHILFNMWWARDFGALMEPTMGRARYLLFILGAAVVSAGAQLGISGQTGIGFSGVVYAMFGYCLAARHVRPVYQLLLTTKNIQLLLGWLGVCILLTAFKVMNIANGAHVAGFAFGYLVGNTGPAKARVHLCQAGLAVLTLFAILSAVYSPWSKNWRFIKARQDVLSQLRHSAAAGDAEAQFDLGQVLYFYQHHKEEGLKWFHKSADQDNPDAINSIAWIEAADPDEHYRNGADAVRRSKALCEKDERKNLNFLDTLAAAYAEVDRFDDAIEIEKIILSRDAELTNATIKAECQAHLAAVQQKKKIRDEPNP